MDESQHESTKEYEMSDVKNYFATTPYAAPVAAAPYAGGFGMGGDGGLLALALLGGGLGFGGRRDHDRNDCASTDQLQTATGSIIDSAQNNVVLQGIGDIKAAVPLAEAQVQLAIAQSQAALSTQIGLTENIIVGGQAVINKGISDAIASSLAAHNLTNINVLAQGSATREAVNAMGVANLTATANSTKEILAAINTTNMANLQRELAVAESALLERNASLRARETEINITNTNTATAQQVQAQSMQQQQFQILAQLAAGVNNLANDVQQVRQGQVTFNSGTMVGSGTQSAANTKVG